MLEALPLPGNLGKTVMKIHPTRPRHRPGDCRHLGAGAAVVGVVSSADARVGGGFRLGFAGNADLRATAQHLDGARRRSTVQPHLYPARQPRDRRAGGCRRWLLQPARPRPARRLRTRVSSARACSACYSAAACSAASAELSSIFGLILQIGLIFIVVRLAMSWWQPSARNGRCLAGPGRGAAVRHRPSAPPLSLFGRGDQGSRYAAVASRTDSPGPVIHLTSLRAVLSADSYTSRGVYIMISPTTLHRWRSPERSRLSLSLAFLAGRHRGAHTCNAKRCRLPHIAIDSLPMLYSLRSAGLSLRDVMLARIASGV